MTKTSLKPLKIPTQARSWATYHAILEATTYILMEQGYESFTTNHVAERAGVRIAWTIRILTHFIVHHGIIDRREDLLSGRMSAELKIMLRKLLL